MFTQLQNKEPIVTAKKMLEYKLAYGHLGDFQAPETMLVCYQSSTMAWLLEELRERIRPSRGVSHLYLNALRYL